MTTELTGDAPALSALPPSAIADLLEASAPTVVVAELGALGDEAGWRPAPGEWSANECVGHLIEAERRGFAGRIRAILAADRPDIPARPRDLGSARSRRGAARSPATGRGAGRRVRRTSAMTGSRWSAACAPTTSRASGSTRTSGELRVDELLGEWVHHDRNHVRQMLAVTQARVWGQMGNARRFSVEDL